MIVKLSVNGCTRGNPGIFVVGGVLPDHRGVALAAFGSFLGHQSIVFVN